MSDNDKLQEYSERHRFWSGIAISQLSFSNNLFLTISIGLFGYCFDKGLNDITTGKIISLPTLYIISLGFLLLAVLYGIMTTFSRLLDFRITRELTQMRKKIFKINSTILRDSEYAEEISDPKICDRICSNFMAISVIFTGYSKISISNNINIKEIKKSEKTNENNPFVSDENFKNKYNKLRKLAHNLGSVSWKYLGYQMLTFFLGAFCYLWCLYEKII